MRLTGHVANGSSTPSIMGMWAVVGGGANFKLHSSYNVASITDNATGDFTLSFAIAFASASAYAVLSSGTSAGIGTHIDHTNPPTASTARIVTVNLTASGFSDQDPTTVIAVGRR